MKRLFFVLAAACCLFGGSIAASAQIRWINPLDEGPVVHGVGWNELKSSFVRLPDSAQAQVREVVWNLSRNSAGLSLVFESDSPEILVRYQVVEGLNMFHMPSTGRSGMDLYATDSDGALRWVAPDFPASFRDTICYRYSNITYFPEGSKSYEFHLYLPLYNRVAWMEIGTPEGASLRFIPETREHPVVVYGTSITQGACASRPGNCWTNIVERELRLPLVNLGFSGNGVLEPPLLEMMAGIDAAAYVLDCTPNLTNATDIEPRLLEAVRILRSKRSCPILIVEHSGNVGEIASNAKGQFRKANAQVRSAYEHLLANGVEGLWYLNHDELGLPMDGMIEGVHPNDLGMRYLADAFEAKFRAMGLVPCCGNCCR